MAEDFGLSVFPAAVQAYATVGVSVVLGFVGIYGYYTKLRGGAATAVASGLDANTRELVDWLSRILAVNTAQAQNLKEIAAMIAARAHVEELDRAYRQGRDETLDRATAKVADKLSHTPSRPR